MQTALNEKPLRVSWSRLREWEDCSTKGWLHYKGYRSPTAEIWPAMFAGTIVDRCMRQWLSADTQTPGMMLASVERIAEEEEKIAAESGDGQVRFRGKEAEVLRNCRECVTALEPLLLEHVVPYDYDVAVRFEAPLTVPHPDGSPRQILLTGEIDLLIRRGALYNSGVYVPGSGDIRVWDLKMTRDSDYWRKTYPQLNFYEIACWLLTDQWPVESALLQPLCAQPIMPFTFTEEDHRELLVRVAKLADEYWRAAHRPKASSTGCDKCYVRQACPKFSRVPGSKRVVVG